MSAKLPARYQWLTNEPAPKMLLEALRLFGILEVTGSGDNPEILAWAKECGIKGYNSDSIPWCGLFLTVIAKRAGKSLPKNPLWARDWANWGTPSLAPSLGDVLVFSRRSGGHVGLYVGEDSACYHVLGGNQGDAVSITRVEKSRLLAARRMYRIGTPANVRKVLLSKEGEISTSEA